MNVIFSCRCCCYCFVCYFCCSLSLSLSPSAPANCCYGIVYVITSPRGVPKSFGIFIHFAFLVPLLVLMVSLPAADSVNLSPEVYLKLIPGVKTKQETLISQEIDFNLTVKNAKLFICIDWLTEPKKNPRKGRGIQWKSNQQPPGKWQRQHQCESTCWISCIWVSIRTYLYRVSELWIMECRVCSAYPFLLLNCMYVAIMYFKLIFDIMKFNLIQFCCCYLFVFMNSFSFLLFSLQKWFCLNSCWAHPGSKSKKYRTLWPKKSMQ